MELPSFKRTRSAMLMHQTLIKWAENQLVKDINREFKRFWRKLQLAVSAEDHGAILMDANELKKRLAEIVQEARVGLVAYTVVDIRRWIRKTNEKLTKDAYDFSALSLEDQQTISDILQNEELRGLDFDTRLARYTVDMQKDIVAVLSQGVADGKSMQELANDLRTPIQGAQYQAARLARTETMHVSNVAAMRTYGSMGDVVSGVQYDATMDGRCCKRCAAFDGLKYYYEPKSGEQSMDEAPQLPLHPNCRCFYAPLSRSWAELGANVTGEETPQERGTYEDWLKGQPEHVQRQMLGDDYDAFQRGGMDAIRRMLTATVPVTKLPGDWKAAWNAATRAPRTESFRLPLLSGKDQLCAQRRKTALRSMTRAFSKPQTSRRES